MAMSARDRWDGLKAIPDRFFRGILVFFSSCSLLFLWCRLYRDYAGGGHEWKQGDWLINSVNGPIRRSFFGDLTLAITDATGMDPLLFVVLVQAVLFLIVYVVVLSLILRSQEIWLVALCFCSAFFVFFWGADPDGTARKELLVFAALLFCTLGLMRNRVWLMVLGCVLYVVSVLSHEAMILFAPVFAVLAVMARAAGQKNVAFERLTLVAVAGGVVCFVWALMHSKVADTASVCQPLLERGLDPKMCRGIISWLDSDAERGFSAVSRYATRSNIAQLLLSYGLALLPFFYASYGARQRRLAVLLAVAPVLCFLPLFTFALDWGRWISFHVFCAILFFVVALHLRLISFERRPDPRVLLVFLGLALLFPPRHTNEVFWGGWLKRAVWEISRLMEHVPTG